MQWALNTPSTGNNRWAHDQPYHHPPAPFRASSCPHLIPLHALAPFLPSLAAPRSNVMKKSMPANPDPSRPPLVAIGDYSATGYFGNDASIATFYTWAGFLVMVPPTGQGVRAALADAA